MKFSMVFFCSPGRILADNKISKNLATGGFVETMEKYKPITYLPDQLIRHIAHVTRAQTHTQMDFLHILQNFFCQ